MQLPEHTARLFAHEALPALTEPSARSLIIGRLLEDGDGDDLRWLTSELPAEELAAFVRTRGGRQLSRRSRAFWAAVLATEPSATVPTAADLWPL